MMLKAAARLLMIAGGLFGTAVTGQDALPSPIASPDDIVVTAERSGIPVWRVVGPQTTVVLVGAIEGIAKGTRWDPDALNAALIKADRVMFPDRVAITGSMFSMIGYLAKWRRQSTLPAGTDLHSLLSSDQYARLTALAARGVLKKGWERKHPLHLALALRDVAKGREGYAPPISQYVTNTVKKYGVTLVPIARSSAAPVADELFASPPASHVPCLMDAVSLVEAGPGTIRARSDAWAQRHVSNVLHSPAEGVYHSCWPAARSPAAKPADELRPAIRRLLTELRPTVVVMSLYSLAQPGGVLDDLRAAGFDVRGPNWQ